MRPEAAAADLVVTSFFDTIDRRIRVVDVVRATAIGVIVAAIGFVPLRLLGLMSGPASLIATTVGLLAAVGTAWLRRWRREPSKAAALVERALPESRNLVFTAREVLATPGTTAPWVRRRVVDGAARILGAADPAAIVPIGKDLLWLGAAALASVVTMALAPAGWARLATAVSPGSSVSGTSAAPTAVRLSIVVTPPVYTGLPERRLIDPAALEIVAGSRVALALENGSGWAVRFGPRVLLAASAAERRTEIVPSDSGYFAVERGGASEATTHSGDRHAGPRTDRSHRGAGERSAAAGGPGQSRPGGHRQRRLRSCRPRARLYKGVRIGRAVRVHGGRPAADDQSRQRPRVAGHRGLRSVRPRARSG